MLAKEQIAGHGKLCLEKGVLCSRKAESLDQHFIWKKIGKILAAFEMDFPSLFSRLSGM